MTRRYGDRAALQGVALEVAAGEICGLLGPNGAGKTTLVSIIAGLRAADEGTVTVDGHDVAKDPHTRSLVGLAGQETAVYPTLRVRANLELMGGLAGLGRRSTAQRIDEVASILELDHLLDRKARFLSGGEKRRLHTAMAMLHRPRLLMLDEPTTGVDIATRTRLLAAIRDLTRRDGCAVLYSTHYLPEIEELGATVAVLDHGRILARGALDELVERHGTGVVELTFENEPPPIDELRRILQRDDAALAGHVVRIPSERPGSEAAGLLARLGDLAADLTSVELGRPSLETVFLAVTGRAFTVDGDVDLADEDMPDHDPNRDPVTAGEGVR